MKLLERKFYKSTETGDIEVTELHEADYMICKQLMTKEEAGKTFPLMEYNPLEGFGSLVCQQWSRQGLKVFSTLPPTTLSFLVGKIIKGK